VIRVAIIADSAVHRAGLASVIGADPEVRVVAASAHRDDHRFPDDRVPSPDTLGSSEEADVIIVAPRRGAPIAALLGTDDSDLDERSRGPAVMVLLERMDASSARDAYVSGASAVLAIDAGTRELQSALRAVAAGLVVMPADVSTELLAGARRVAADSSARPVASAALTSREREVLMLLVQGLANKVIAARLGITEHTVKTHIAAVYEKLQARNRAEVLVAAARQGLVIL
jgi:DNA-binding NarL/FixJ family response regulator